MSDTGLNLTVLPGSYAVCRLEADAAVEPWMLAGEFCSVTRTRDELSLVLPEDAVTEAIQSEGGWRCLKVMGPLDFSLTGILSALSGALAGAGISLFAVSTYDTDYLLIKDVDLERAVETLRNHGHRL